MAPTSSMPFTREPADSNCLLLDGVGKDCYNLRTNI